MMVGPMKKDYHRKGVLEERFAADEYIHSTPERDLKVHEQ